MLILTWSFLTSNLPRKCQFDVGIGRLYDTMMMPVTYLSSVQVAGSWQFPARSKWAYNFLGHVMRRHGLENLAVTVKVDGRKGRRRQRLKYLDSVCSCLKDKVSLQ